MRLTDTFIVGDTIVEVALADITTADVDVIVNSICDQLHLGTGVSGAILLRGGHSIYKELLALECSGPISPGHVTITRAGELPYKHIFHAISSSCSEGSSERILRDCVSNALEEARKLKVKRIAFPALGTGEMALDVKIAAIILIKTVIRDCIGKGGLNRIVFCLLRPDAFTTFFREAVKQTIQRESGSDAGQFVLIQNDESPCGTLKAKLRACPCGKAGWKEYEGLAVDTFTHLFVPPLAAARIQERSENNLRIRDAVFPNYAENGFWALLDRRYGATLVLLECKNYTDPVGQEAVHQVSRYLKSGTLGKIAMICSRGDASPEALKARTEIFRDSKHIVLFLSDFDLEQMIDLKRIGALPETYLQRKLEDFLLAY